MNDWHARDVVTSRLRLRGYDYSTPGNYFITICTTHRINRFGYVQHDEMVLSTAGLMVESWWSSIPKYFPGVLLDDMIVMPNHVHGLISIGTDPDVDVLNSTPSLSEVISWFKSKTTHDYVLGVRTLGWSPFPGKLWQPRFYDHIVRSDAALKRVRAYIGANPANWQTDEENPALH